MVLTSSFHATAFSIILQKDFYCIDLNMGQDGRLKDILGHFHLTDRFICSFDEYKTRSVVPFCCEMELTKLKNDAARFVASLV